MNPGLLPVAYTEEFPLAHAASTRSRPSPCSPASESPPHVVTMFVPVSSSATTWSKSIARGM